ncbi:MAG: histidinol-phosphate transaminase [Chloroflexi bacterium]|nr:histidinol-phosphate transaminase [Chloroflexota bacterium]
MRRSPVQRDIRPRDAVERMAPYEPPDSAVGDVPPRIILDANENPFGPTPGVQEALANFHRYHRYPDPGQKALRGLIGDYAGVDADQLMVGNGSDELIDLLCRIYLEPGDEVIDCTPTFGMYRFSADLCGATVVEAPRGDVWQVDLGHLRQAISRQTKIIFVATPNNPTGNHSPRSTVDGLLDTGCIVVLDEAYVEFAGSPSLCTSVADHPNLVVLRTFSKWAGLAGLRIGFGAFPSSMMANLWKVKPPFNVNLAAEVAVRASLEDLPLARERIQSIVSERDRMAEALGAVPGLRVWPSDANFVLVTNTERPQGKLKDHLKTDGIAVRTYSHPRLQGAIRISVGLPEQTDELLRSVRRWAGA